MNCLYVNTVNHVCGVHSYGKNLFRNLEPSSQIRWTYCEPDSIGAFRTFTSMPEPDAVVYNWSSLIGGFLLDAPFAWLHCPQVFVFHDADVSDRFDAILFSDPTFTPHGKWHVIGRPLPPLRDCRKEVPRLGATMPIIGVHGFVGAWADQVVWRVMQEFEFATVRLSLPFAVYGDAGGGAATGMAERCRSMVQNNPGINLHITHDFMPPERLLEWLAQNDMNCYIRPADMPWRGISSAPDFALAARRPFCVNRCNAFRHLHHLNPSICVEDSSLTDIFASGLAPQVAFIAKWCDPEVIRSQVEEVLFGL